MAVIEDIRTPVGVDIDNVTVRFGATVAVDSFSLSLAPGTVTALVGESGCGKSTLLRTVSGLEDPAEGSVTVGRDVVVDDGTFIAAEARGVGLVFQDGALFDHLDVGRNVGFGLPRGQRRAGERIDELLALVGLDGMQRRSPLTLSGGQRQRVALARALAPRPRVLLLDEPFANLDAVTRRSLRTELVDVLAAQHITALLVTHDRDEAFVLGDRLAVMREGRLLQTGTPEEVYQQPRTRWVAQFLGDTNAAPQAWVDATGWAGAMIRPERIQIASGDAAAPPGDLPVVPGTIDKVLFRGDHHDITVSLPDNSHLTVRVQGPLNGLVPTTPVSVTADAAALMAFADADTDAEMAAARIGP